MWKKNISSVGTGKCCLLFPRDFNFGINFTIFFLQNNIIQTIAFLQWSYKSSFYCLSVFTSLYTERKKNSRDFSSKIHFTLCRWRKKEKNNKIIMWQLCFTYIKNAFMLYHSQFGSYIKRWFNRSWIHVVVLVFQTLTFIVWLKCNSFLNFFMD